MSTRKILYSPDFGAGWTSWAGGEVVKFMLTYQPFIDHIENGGGSLDSGYNGHLDRKGLEEMKDKFHPVVYQFCVDCLDKFGEVPYLGGLRNLTVATVSGRSRIQEHDGYESYEEEGHLEGWL